MSVFGKIATGSLIGMAAGIHIRVDAHAARISPNSLKNRPFTPLRPRSPRREVTAL
jgi:hypothetical protein